MGENASTTRQLPLWRNACRDPQTPWWLRPLLRQFGHPRGVLGAVVGTIMARKSDGRRRTAWTLDRLQLHPEARVLEIGFGPGLGLEGALRRTPNGQVVGVDHSALMVRRAARRLAQELDRGRLDLRVVSADQLPDLGRFSHAFAINSAQFWRQPGATVARIVECLEPGGRLALTFQPPWRGAAEEDAREAGAALGGLLEAAGLEAVSVELLQLDRAPAACALGSKTLQPTDGGGA